MLGLERWPGPPTASAGPAHPSCLPSFLGAESGRLPVASGAVFPLCPFRELGAVDKILGPLTEVLEGVLQADQQLMEKTKAKVFSAFITVLQMKEMRGERAA